MNTVSREEVLEAWTRLCDLDETESGVLVKKFMDEQPALGIYVSWLPRVSGWRWFG